MRFFAFFFLLASLAPAAFRADWNQPFPPHKIAGNVYYVGTNYLASYLIVTPQGNILINPDFDKSVPLIRKNIEQLGFKFADTKILLISHSHDDHCEGAALVKKLTGAKFYVMAEDAPEMEDGGKSDFDPTYIQHWTPAKVDRRLKDGEVVELGGTQLTAHRTPGHTKGCTTWTMTVNGKNLVIVGSPNANSDYILVNNKLYPQIVDDFRKGLDALAKLPCDIFLGAHGLYYGLEKKYAKLKAGDANAFVDPQGYQDFVKAKKKEFEEKLAAQQKK